MVMTIPERSRGLRETVAEIDQRVSHADRFRAEIIRGQIVMSPTPPGKHAGIVYAVQEQFILRKTPGLACDQVVSVTAPPLGEDYAIPDLVVLSQRFHDSSEWLARVADDSVEFVLEVVSPSSATQDTQSKPDWYAEAGVPLFLLVDPRGGSWRLLSQPDSRHYRARVDGVFGEDIVLPEPFDFALQTKEFKRYE